MRHRFWRQQFSKAKLARNLAILVLTGTVAGFLMVGLLFAWYARDLPQPDKIVRKEGFATKILDRNETLLYEVFADQQRTPVELEQVPEHLKLATIAIEDKTFFEHRGFDLKGLGRAMYVILTQRRLVGGSTLTQQLVKNVLLTQEKTLPRKIKEFILAVQIESKYSKEEILTMYLNEAPYGGTAWGVATAAQTYFGKDVSELDLVESAVLAGMPQLPTVYSPFGKNPTAYIGRTEHVLRRMREEGFITKEEEKAAAESLADVEFKKGYSSIKAPHFVLYVKEKLVEMYGENLVEQGGLRVTTSLDYDLHQKAQEIVTEEIADVENLGIGNGAALVMNPQTGEIWSMVGSKDFFTDEYDGQVNVTLSLRQPGSTIKPVTYVTAFKKGLSPAYMIMDIPSSFGGGAAGQAYTPVNYDGKFRGPIQLRYALGSSLNIPAVKLLAIVGIKDMLQTAYDMGFDTLEPTKANMDRFGLAVTLGGGEVRLLDLTSAYSAFANGGLRTEPVSILKVEDKDGKVIFEHKTLDKKRVLKQSEAFLINHILSDNSARLLTFGANSYLNMGNRPVAVKTGTTNDKRDNWAIGWSTSGIVGVWVGNNDNSPMKQVASGVTGASPIWRRIILEVLSKYPASAWNIPDDVEAVEVDTISGYPAHDGFASRTEYVIKGSLPGTPDPIHVLQKLCPGQMRLATEVDIVKNNFEQREFIDFTKSGELTYFPAWLTSIQGWIGGITDPTYHPPTEFCDSANIVEVSLEDPKNGKVFDDTEVPVKVKVTTQGEVASVAIWVNGAQQEVLTGRPYETVLNLPAGIHTLKAVVKRTDGRQGESETVTIGTGGVKIEEPKPTKKPEPTIQVLRPEFWDELIDSIQ